MIRILCFTALVALSVAHAVADVLNLSGPGWTFALDPTDRGESMGWHEPDVKWDGARPYRRDGWDEVSVPHDYLTDPRYAYTGVAWYRRSLAVPADAADGRAWRLQFDTVFQRCRVWLNGRFVGSHEGGYTPFEFSVANFLLPGRENLLVVAVDNRVKFRALPGARSGNSANAGQYPWLNYGGILGGVRLVGHESVWIAGQKIETASEGSAWRLGVRVDVCNDTSQEHAGRVAVSIANAPCELSGDYRVAAGSRASVWLETTLPGEDVRPWELAAPVVYESRARLDQSATEHVAPFGFRTIEVREGQLRLNGRAIRWAGANRARGHPQCGGVDPDELVDQDLRLMKDAGLVFSRIQHTAPGRNLLDWADRHGMLLVLEVGMWGYVSADQASPELRTQFEAEMRELIALAQNSPSVIGWSLGNEYESWTPEGLAWTRDMAAFVRGLDRTRPVTFAALGGTLRRIKASEAEGEHAFDHVDYISANYYLEPAAMAAFLDPVHARWPDKPVAITEFGLRSDRVASEQERLAHLDAMLGEVAERPWICGMSFWSFNDYASRYPGSGADGYRRWGLVDEFRRPRALYRRAAEVLQDGLPAAARGVTSDEAASLAVEAHARRGVPNFHARASAGRAVRVAYLGGSITAADGWRVETLKFLRNRYPDTVIEEILAAVPGTGSTLGVARLQADVLDHAPDLLFVEFAVNDGALDPALIERSMEGIVRKTWSTRPGCDIVFVYTLRESMLADYQAGRLNRSASAMERVAEHYDIPTLAFGFEVAHGVDAGTWVFTADKSLGAKDETGRTIFSYDSVHPIAAGHAIYAGIVERHWPELTAGQGVVVLDRLGVPLNQDNWESVQIVSVGEMKGADAWQEIARDDARFVTSKCRIVPRVWRTTVAGAVLEAIVTGSTIGAVGFKNVNTVAFRVFVDDLPPIEGSFRDQPLQPEYRLKSWFDPRRHGSGPHRVRLEPLFGSAQGAELLLAGLIGSGDSPP